MDDPSRYMCPYTDCCKSYLTKWDLTNHIRIVHEGDTSTKCNVCQKTFMKRGNLKSHIQKGKCQAVSNANIINLSEYPQLQVCVLSKITKESDKEKYEPENAHDREDIPNAAKRTKEEEKENILNCASSVTEETIVEDSKGENVNSGKDIEKFKQNMSEEAKKVEFSCDICHQDFQSRCKLRKHICLTSNWTETTSTPVEREMVAKPIEGANFHISKDIQLTMKSTQKEEIENTLQDVSDVREETETENGKEKSMQNRLELENSNLEEDKSGEFSCDVCSQYFKYRYEILKHVCLASKGTEASETLFEREIFSKPHKIKKFIKNVSKKGKMKDNKLLEYRCNKCSFSSQKERFLTIHRRRRHGEKSHNCSNCQEHFPDLRDLKRHIYAKHMGIFCHLCRCQPSTEKELEEHNSEKHDGITFSCTECNFVTSSKLNLEMHEKIHIQKLKNNKQTRKHKDRIILLICPECSFESSNKMDLIVHRNEHDYYKWLHANGLFPESATEMSSSE